MSGEIYKISAEICLLCGDELKESVLVCGNCEKEGDNE